MLLPVGTRGSGSGWAPDMDRTGPPRAETGAIIAIGGGRRVVHVAAEELLPRMVGNQSL